VARVHRINGFATISPCRLYRYELGGDLVSNHEFKRRQREAPEAQLDLQVAATRRELATVAPPRTLLVIMWNPSKANAIDTDPTITRCNCYAYDWGFRRILVGNANAFRATYPQDMAAAAARGVDIVGPENDRYLRSMMERASMVLVVWGAELARERALEVQAIARAAGVQLMCLNTNKDGSPVHPLYQNKSLTPKAWIPTGDR